MIGHDIAVIEYGKSGNRTDRYLERILGTGEKTKLTAFSVPAVRLALAWSLKEASFKYCNRLMSLPFVPKDHTILEVSDRSIGLPAPYATDLSGFGFSKGMENSRIRSPLGVLYAKSWVTKDYVLSMAANSTKVFDEVRWGVFRIKEQTPALQSSEVRKHAIRHFMQCANKPGSSAYKFVKDKNGAPVLYVDKAKSNTCFSFTHQYQYVSYAWHA